MVSGHSGTLASEWPSTKRDDIAAHIIMQDHSGGDSVDFLSAYPGILVLASTCLKMAWC